MNEIKQAITTKSQRINTKDLVMTGMFTAVICIMSLITLPTQPIPFTLSLFAIFLTGALLEPRLAFLSTLAYLLLGAFGIPVFAGFRGGLQALTGMTGGYLMSYPLMAIVIALCYKYIKKYKILALAIGMTLSLFLCYFLGTLWFMFISGNDLLTSLTLCVFPYAAFDLIKIILAISISTVIRKTAMKRIS
jgi:biotin transport system substrate-specific component